MESKLIDSRLRMSHSNPVSKKTMDFNHQKLVLLTTDVPADLQSNFFAGYLLQIPDDFDQIVKSMQYGLNR